MTFKDELISKSKKSYEDFIEHDKNTIKGLLMDAADADYKYYMMSSFIAKALKVMNDQDVFNFINNELHLSAEFKTAIYKDRRYLLIRWDK